MFRRSQGSRVRTASRELPAQLLVVGHAGKEEQVLGGLRFENVDDVVEGHPTQKDPVLRDHGDGHEVVTADQVPHVLLVCMGSHRSDDGLHQVLDGLVRFREDQIVQGNGAQQPRTRRRRRTRCRSSPPRGPAPAPPDGLPRGDSAQHRDQCRGHDAAGGLLVVLEKVQDLSGLVGRKLRQDAVLILRLQLSDEVSRIVVGELVEELRALCGLQSNQELHPGIPLLHLGQGLGCELRRKGAHQGQARLPRPPTPLHRRYPKDGARPETPPRPPRRPGRQGWPCAPRDRENPESGWCSMPGEWGAQDASSSSSRRSRSWSRNISLSKRASVSG